MSDFRPLQGDAFFEMEDGLSEPSPYDRFTSLCISESSGATKVFVPNDHVDGERPKSVFAADNVFFEIFNDKRVAQVSYAEFLIEQKRDPESGQITFRRNVSPLIKKDWQGKAIAYPGGMMDLYRFIEEFKPLQFISLVEYNLIRQETAAQRRIDRATSSEAASWRNAQSNRLEQARSARENPQAELAKGIAAGVAQALAELGFNQKKKTA